MLTVNVHWLFPTNSRNLVRHHFAGSKLDPHGVMVRWGDHGNWTSNGSGDGDSSWAVARSDHDVLKDDLRHTGMVAMLKRWPSARHIPCGGDSSWNKRITTGDLRATKNSSMCFRHQERCPALHGRPGRSCIFRTSKRTRWRIAEPEPYARGRGYCKLPIYSAPKGLFSKLV